MHKANGMSDGQHDVRVKVSASIITVSSLELAVSSFLKSVMSIVLWHCRRNFLEAVQSRRSCSINLRFAATNTLNSSLLSVSNVA